MANPEKWYCPICNRQMEAHSKNSHEGGVKHRIRLHETGNLQENSTALDLFFQSYDGFDYRPALSPETNYDRLLRCYEWTKKRGEGREAWVRYRNALVKEFNDWYGGTEVLLSNWHNLCRALGVDNPPDTIDECRALVSGYNVNMVDLISNRRSGGTKRVKNFASVKELAQYTVKTGKFFPRRRAEAGNVLRYLLRAILSNAKKSRKRRRGRGRARQGQPAQAH